MLKIAIIVGHPDPSEERLNRAFANRYAEAARAAGCSVRWIDIARMEIPLLRTAADFYDARAPESIANAQNDILWADHVVLFYPLWIGDVPALLKGFIEQTFRPGFAMEYAGPRRFPKGLLGGKSARIVVTMGMPALVYRAYFGAYALKNLVLNLERCGFAPVRTTLIGGVAGACESRRRKWLESIAYLARRDARSQRRKMAGPAKLLGAAVLLAAGAYCSSVVWAWARFGSGRRKASPLDDLMPEYDARLDHAAKVHAPAALTFDVLREADLERSLLVRALFRVREILLGGRDARAELPQGFFKQLDWLGWRCVAQEPGEELIFAAVTQPWEADPTFRGLGFGEFRRFSEPGYVKIAFSLRIDPIALDYCIARTETRAIATDTSSRSRFRRYWALLSPGIEMIRIVLLAQLKAESEARWKETAAATSGRPSLRG